MIHALAYVVLPMFAVGLLIGIVGGRRAQRPVWAPKVGRHTKRWRRQYDRLDDTQALPVVRLP